MRWKELWQSRGHHLAGRNQLARLWLVVAVAVGVAGSWAGVAHAQDAECAEVKIVIEQKLSLERQAFDAHMVMTNGLDSSALSNVKIDLVFKDQDQNDVLATADSNATGAAFFVRTDKLTGLSATDGSASLAAKTTADIRWLIIPSQGAGGNTPQGRLYYIGARVTYTFAGRTSTVDVTPDYVVVRPQPLLRLDYFLPADVFADDPLTPETEVAEPFTVGVRVANVGAGTAANTKIESAQPKIVDNRQGLLIDFSILGGYVGNALVGKSLLLDFGDIAPQNAKIGRWLMQASLAGRFTEFNASFVHADSLGGAVTSLIQQSVAHTLVRDVRIDLPGHDDIDDFLAEEGDSDRAYDSQGSDSTVLNLSGSATLNRLSGGDLALKFAPTQGLVHVKLADPARGARQLVQVLRSDGKQLLPQNFWLSKVRHADLSLGYFVHIFDSTTPGQYTLVFTDSDAVSLSGAAYLDTNGNGVRDTGDTADSNLIVTLKGVNSQGQNVSVQAYTDSQGRFSYDGLAPGRYQLASAERSGWINGTWVAGSAGGTLSAGLMSDIVLLAGTKATGYVLSKRKPLGSAGQTTAADISVSIQSNVHDMYPGQTATVTITAHNQGPGTASGVAVQAALPAGLSQQVATAGQGAYEQGVWAVGSLSRDQSATLTLQVKAEPLSDGNARAIRWTATAGAQTADPETGNNQSRLNLLVQKPQTGADLVQTLVAQSRVLVWGECPDLTSSAESNACALAKVDTARTWLSTRANEVLAATQLNEWRAAMRSGKYNVLWFVGGMSGLDDVGRAEVRAAVRRGESLVVEGAAGTFLAGIADVLGAIPGNVPAGENLAVSLRGGSLLGTKGAAYALQLTDALPVATYATSSGAAAIATRTYGQGQVLLAGFGLLDTAADSAYAGWSTYAAQQLRAVTPAVRIQPALADSSFGVELRTRSLLPPGGPAQAVTLQLDLTAGLAYRDARPSAQAGGIGTQPAWAFTLAADQEQAVTLTLVTPQVSAAGEAKAQLLNASDQSLLATQALEVQVLGLETLVPRIHQSMTVLAGSTAEQQALIALARAAATDVQQAQANRQWSPALAALTALQAHLDQLAALTSALALSDLQLDVARWFFLVQRRWVMEAPQPAQITAISGSGQFAMTGQAFGQVLAAQVLNGHGQPVADALVLFDLPGSGSSARFAVGLTRFTATTDAQGIARSPSLTANGAAGRYQVQASTPGVSDTALFELENRAQSALPLNLQIVDGQGQSTAVLTLFDKSLSVRVLDGQNRPQANIEVRFEAPVTGATAAFEGQGANAPAVSVVTDASGVAASPLLRANASTGGYSVRAGLVSNALTEVAFPLTNTAASVSTPVFTGTTATGSGSVTARVTGGGPSCAFNSDKTHLLPASGMSAVLGRFLLPHGVFDFELVSCTPGSEVTITTTWPDLRGITGYLKYGVTPLSVGTKIWYPPRGLHISGHTVSYTIRDGGWGDDDLTVNGVIRDPGGPVIAAGPVVDPAPIPVLDVRAIAALSLALLAGAGMVLRRRRRRNES